MYEEWIYLRPFSNYLRPVFRAITGKTNYLFISETKFKVQNSATAWGPPRPAQRVVHHLDPMSFLPSTISRLRGAARAFFSGDFRAGVERSGFGLSAVFRGEDVGEGLERSKRSLYTAANERLRRIVGDPIVVVRRLEHGAGDARQIEGGHTGSNRRCSGVSGANSV